LKQGDALSPLLLNFALEYAIRRAQVNQDGLKLNVTNQLLVYLDDINVLGGSVRTVKKPTEVLVVVSKVVGLEVNAEKTMYMVMSRDQHGGQNHSIKTGSKSFARVEQFGYFGATLKGKGKKR
jgi:hypothetical protein